MYICSGCGQAFDHYNSWYETHGLDSGPYEYMTGSPCCGDGYDLAEQCCGCGESFSANELIDGLCVECREGEGGMTYLDRILLYETEKKKIAAMGLSPKEYEAEIKRLIEKYKI